MCLDLFYNIRYCEFIMIVSDAFVYCSIMWLFRLFCSIPPPLYGSQEELRFSDAEKKHPSRETPGIRKVHSPDIFFDYGLTNPLRQSEHAKRSVCPRCYKVFRIVNDYYDDDHDDSVVIGPHMCDEKAPLNLKLQLERSRGIKQSLKLKMQLEKEKRIQSELKRRSSESYDSDSGSGSSSPEMSARNIQENDILPKSSYAKRERTIQNWIAGVESSKVDQLRTIKKQPRPIIRDPNLRSEKIRKNGKLHGNKRRRTSKAKLRQVDVTKVRPVSCPHDGRLNETVKVTRPKSLDGLRTIQRLLDRDTAMGSNDKNLEMHRLLLERDRANAVNDKLQLLQFQQMLDDNEYFASLARASKTVRHSVIHEKKRIPARVYRSGPVPTIYNSFSSVPTTKLPADYQRRHTIGAEDYGGRNLGLRNSLSSSITISIPESIDSVTSDDIDKMVD